MENLLMGIIILAFLGLLGLNIFFREKVLKTYKTLVQNRVQFNAMDILNPSVLDKICQEHPAHRNDIQSFAKNIKNSVQLAIGLIALITLFGAVLMYYRNQ